MLQSEKWWRHIWTLMMVRLRDSRCRRRGWTSILSWLKVQRAWQGFASRISRKWGRRRRSRWRCQCWISWKCWGRRFWKSGFGFGETSDTNNIFQIEHLSWRKTLRRKQILHGFWTFPSMEFFEAHLISSTWLCCSNGANRLIIGAQNY